MKNALCYFMTSFITMTPHELILFCRHRTGYIYCYIVTLCPNGPFPSTSCSVPCISSLWVVPPSKSGTWKSSSVCHSLSPTHHRMCSITKLSGLGYLNRSPPPHCYYLSLCSCYLTHGQLQYPKWPLRLPSVVLLHLYHLPPPLFQKKFLIPRWPSYFPVEHLAVAPQFLYRLKPAVLSIMYNTLPSLSPLYPVSTLIIADYFPVIPKYLEFQNKALILSANIYV